MLVDPTGARGAPHYRAIDMASDNRIAPMAPATTTHAFTVPTGCAAADVTATLIYRQIPVALARQRGWDARDHVVGTAKATVSLP